MATRRTIEFLDGQKAKYAVIRHSPAHSAQEVAASAHIPGRSMAKTVVVSIDGKLALAVVPASRDVELEMLRSALDAHLVRLADRDEFSRRFEGCRIGTMPPLGNLFGMDTYVDRDLEHEDYIAFNAGSLTEVIAMRFKDYRMLAHPTMLKMSTKPYFAMAGHAH